MEGRDRDRESFAFKTESAFLGKDHVGLVRHFEGIFLSAFADIVRQAIITLNFPFKEGREIVSGRDIYTNVAEADKNIFLWVKAIEINDVGVVADIKVIHSTDDSARADELLSSFTEMIEMQLRNDKP